MKQIIIILSCLFALSGCDNRTPAQKAEDKFNAEKAKRDAHELIHEAYIDSLVDVAAGLNGVSKPKNRRNALNILKKEYPALNDRWDRFEECIDNMDIYTE